MKLNTKPQSVAKAVQGAALPWSLSALRPSALVLCLAFGSAVLLILPSCSKQEESAEAKPVVIETAPALEPQPFTPPETGLLTEDQVRRFLEAHKAMNRINELYLDSLIAAPPERKRSVYQALDIARDKVTRHFGLNGYEEYRWILEDAPRHPANVRILERMQVTTLTR